MAEWVKPAYPRSEVRRAGQQYVDPAMSILGRASALNVINNWRSAHGFPLNTMQATLRRMARTVESDALVAQRTKRLPSIERKLRAEHPINLTDMQDIGGCRAIMSDLVGVYNVVDKLAESRMLSTPVGAGKDYILSPKTTGYRGVHRIFRYKGQRTSEWDGLKIEVQVRTQLQHAWATAVETIGFFTQQGLKSNVGDADWLRFFALMGSVIAIREGSPLVPGTPDDLQQLYDEVAILTLKLQVVQKLVAWRTALDYKQNAGRGSMYVMVLDIPKEVLNVYPYRTRAEANTGYEAFETVNRDQPGVDVVLVSVSDLDLLRRAYPNYFLDTFVFQEIVQDALAEADG